ncbi:MAG: FKBP-type peptidyl-prolyl cis-trans isomerase [Steroidobacteraceae bacterium]
MAPRKLQIYAAALCASLLAACGGKPADVPSSVAHSLEIVELRPGTGAALAAGQGAVVQYTGWLYEATAPDTKGKQFDSSSSTGQPFRFTVGAGQVIKGWDQGVVGMKVGGSRRLTIPAELAYGDRGAGGMIPPGATLVFDVELVGIE